MDDDMKRVKNESFHCCSVCCMSARRWGVLAPWSACQGILQETIKLTSCGEGSRHRGVGLWQRNCPSIRLRQNRYVQDRKGHIRSITTKICDSLSLSINTFNTGNTHTHTRSKTHFIINTVPVVKVRECSISFHNKKTDSTMYYITYIQFWMVKYKVSNDIRSFLTCLNVMYKWNLGPNHFSYFCQSSCTRAQNSPAACAAKSWGDNRWQQTLNIYKLRCAQENDLPLTSSTLTSAIVTTVEPNSKQEG